MDLCIIYCRMQVIRKVRFLINFIIFTGTCNLVYVYMNMQRTMVFILVRPPRGGWVGGGGVTSTSFKDFGLSRPGIEPTYFRSREKK